MIISFFRKVISAAAENQASAAAVGQADNDNMLIAVIIAAVVIFVICVAVIVCLIVLNKNNKNNTADAPKAAPPAEAENDKTEFIDSSSEGETSLLFLTDPIFRISLTDENNPGKEFTANTSENIIIGRSHEEATIVIDYDKSISKSHCIIFAEAGKVYVRDLNSANKTFVNGYQVIDKAELTDGCILKAGRVLFKVKITER